MDLNRALAADRLVRFVARLALNLILIVATYRVAYELRFDFATPEEQLEMFWLSLPLLVVLRFAVYANFGVFRAHWLQFGPHDLLRLGLAATISSLGFFAVLYLSDLSHHVPGSVLLIEWAGAIFLAGGIPLIVRALRETPVPFTARRGRRTLIIGAGERAEQVLREARRAGICALNPVGLIGLNGTLRDCTIHGVSVVGTVDELRAVCARLKADLVIIAVEPDELGEMSRVVNRCIAAGLEFKTLPSLQELLDGRAGVNQFGNVPVEDLLSHPRVNLDSAPVAADLRNRVILLTGAAGSIGSELARQIAALAPSRLVLLDQAESDLYYLHLELSRTHPQLDFVPVICDITNTTRLSQLFGEQRPDYVVHAAAYKHVSLMEANVFEAVRNNVLGTLLVATAAVEYGATKFLLVSTDKAIRPSSVMGATKRVAERILFALPNLHRSGTDFRVVRFGNVLASNERQLTAGSPVTATHPPAQCHLMARSEAAQLILQAGTLPESRGAITLFEATVPNSGPKIRISQSTESADPELVQGLSRLLGCLDAASHDGILRTLCELVPECAEPLAQYRPVHDVRVDAPSNRRDSGAWQTLLNTSHSAWRERRRGARWVPPAGPRTEERRAGLECRRKEARAGGRRRTDLGILATESTPHRIGAEAATPASGQSSTACREAVS